jgi:hypothetical protein
MSPWNERMDMFPFRQKRWVMMISVLDHSLKTITVVVFNNQSFPSAMRESM